MSGTAPAGADPSGSPPHGRRRSFEVAGLVVAALGVLVAILAWQLPKEPDPSPPAGAASVSSPVTTPPGTPPSTPPTTSTSAGQRHLTELTPSSGGGFVQRIGGTHSLTMSCATGDSVDFKRSVTYDLPRAGYATLRLTALPTGERDTRIEVRLLVDDVVRGDQRLQALRDRLSRLGHGRAGDYLRSGGEVRDLRGSHPLPLRGCGAAGYGPGMDPCSSADVCRDL